jgi:membrane protease YdiL (CAAX protease family)/Flp pilus assembly protein TadD
MGAEDVDRRGEGIEIETRPANTSKPVCDTLRSDSEAPPLDLKPLARLNERVSTAPAMTAVQGIIGGALFLTCVCHAAVEEPAEPTTNSTHVQVPGEASNTLQTLPGESSESPILAKATNAQGFLEIAYSYYRKEAYKEAIAPFKMAISLEPTNYEAKLWLGFTYYYLQDFDAAMEALRAAAECEPGNPEPHYWLGSALYTLRKYGQAAVAYRQTLALATNQPRAWLGLGYCQYGQKSFQAAVESFQQCALIDPTNYSAQVWLGHSLVQLDRVKDAASAFSNAVSLYPHDYEANLGRGMTLLRLSRFGEAIPSLERALETKPRARFPRWGLFLSYLATGQIDKISRLHLGILPVISILLGASYLPALWFIFRKSLRLHTRSSPGIGLTLGWCSVTMLGQTVIILALSLVFSWSMSQSIGPGVALPAVPLIGAAVFGFSRQPWGAPFAWPQRIPGAKLVLVAFVAMGGMVLFERGYTWFVERLTGKGMPEQMIVILLGSGGYSFWLAFLGMGLVAPTAEEILFRGLLFGAIGRWLSGPWTIVVTAAVFALAHLQPIYFLPLFGVGLVLGWARQKSGGLALPIALHCVNNCGALLMTSLSPGH